jgi:hypothetical protein
MPMCSFSLVSATYYPRSPKIGAFDSHCFITYVLAVLSPCPFEPMVRVAKFFPSPALRGIRAETRRKARQGHREAAKQKGNCARALQRMVFFGAASRLLRRALAPSSVGCGTGLSRSAAGRRGPRRRTEQAQVRSDLAVTRPWRMSFDPLFQRRREEEGTAAGNLRSCTAPGGSGLLLSRCTEIAFKPGQLLRRHVLAAQPSRDNSTPRNP